MNYLKKIVTILILLSIHELSYSQLLKGKSKKEKKKIENFFLKDLPWKSTEDSTMIIGFSFKIKVEENEIGLSQATSITASDSIAYKLFPNYELLKTINYKLFLQNKKKAEFIIPVLIELVGSQTIGYYDREKLINFSNNTVFNKALYKGAWSMFHLNNDHIKNIENYIYLKPVIIWMDKRISN